VIECLFGHLDGWKEQFCRLHGQGEGDFTVTATLVDSSQKIYGRPIHMRRRHNIIGYRDERKKGRS